jgi:Fe-S cluster biogenesis protein NfuA
MNETAVAAALETLRPSLDADGFELRLASVSDDGTVSVVLHARPDACLECLVPDEMMVQIIDRAVRDQEPAIHRVEMTKEGFADLSH